MAAKKRRSRAKVKKPTKVQRETRRDVSVALGYVMEMQEAVEAGKPVAMVHLNELAQILGDIDARTGRRDPTKRQVIRPGLITPPEPVEPSPVAPVPEPEPVPA